MGYKYKYFRKGIPKQYQEQLGLTEFKLSLKDIDSKHQTLIKARLDVEFDNVYKNIEQFNKDRLVEVMKLVYNKTLLDLYGIGTDIVDKYLLNKSKELPTYSLKDGIELFKVYNTKDKQLSPTTLKNHSIYAKRLTRYLGEDKDVTKITQEELERFKNSLTLTNNSWNNNLAYYTGLFNFLIKKQKLKDNLFKTLDRAATTDSTKEEFTTQDLKQLFQNVEDKDVELSMMIELYTGMRIDEVAKLSKSNIINYDTINIDYLKDTRTKKHNRQIPIHPVLSKYLKEHLPLINSDKLFTTNHLGDKVNRYIRKQLNDKNKSSHSFRRNFRVALQLSYPDREKYINVLTAHSNSKSIGFHLYGRNQANWDVLVEMIESIDYKI